MNEHIFKGSWKEIKGEVQKQWGKLTDDQLTEIEGNNNSIIGFLEKQYGYSKKKAEEELNRFLEENGDKLKNWIPRIYENIGNQVSNAASQVKSASVKGSEVLKERIQDKPLAAVGIAALAGFLIGWCLKKR